LRKNQRFPRPGKIEIIYGEPITDFPSFEKLSNTEMMSYGDKIRDIIKTNRKIDLKYRG